MFVKDNCAILSKITLIEIYGYYGLFSLERNTHGGGDRLNAIALGWEKVFLTAFF